MSAHIRLGALVMPEHTGRAGTDLWRRLEESGFRHAWLFDHLSWRSLRDGPWLDTMTTLAAAAVVTSRIRLGTLVCTPNFRHPVLLAKAAMTIDQLSGGRLTLGLGSGAPGPDSAALGAPPLSVGQRAARFAEFVHLTDHLLRHPRTDHRGTWYQAEDVPMIPGCRQQPRVPFAIAAAGPAGLGLAVAHAEMWVTNGPMDPGEGDEERLFRLLGKQIARLDEACVEAGRSPGSIRRLVYLSRCLPSVAESADRLADALGRCAVLGFTDAVVAYPRRDGIFAGDPRHLERLAAAQRQEGMH
ncbi:LLM class flavin-dependent oxidoreductase [Micromonospora sp. NPDC051196]|uniref:LLM class flavin-dependent oxidoreductase n=1 Tax=Micromonospora sp. NPDC051196 TaxID=3155281 RepID=UPI00342E47FF